MLKILCINISVQVTSYYFMCLVSSSDLTVRVRVDGVDKLSVRGVQPVRGVSSFKHGPSRVQACVIEGCKSHDRLTK